jgi:[acyl-carrier-protein] S-malonyltransferase
VELFSLNTPDQLDDARDFVDRHADDSHYDLSTTPSWRLVVSPGKGRFTRDASINVDDKLAAHTMIGSVKNLRDEVPVAATYGGVVLEWLVEDDDPVAPGQPLLRLHPSPSSIQEDHA